MKCETKEEQLREEHKYIKDSIQDEKCLNVRIPWTGFNKHDYQQQYKKEHRDEIQKNKYIGMKIQN